MARDKKEPALESISPTVEADLAVLAAMINGGPPRASVVDQRFLKFALRRHGVGTRQIADWAVQNAPAALKSQLTAHEHRALHSRWQEMHLLSQIDTRFGAEGICWAILKGAPLMQQLYGDPAARSSSDIDLLVRPAQFVQAISVLEREGWTHAQSPLRVGRSHFALKRVRDIDLVSPSVANLRIELHQRPLFAEAFHHTGAALLESVERAPLPAPRFGPLLVWYCFAHGAVSYWTRLRWLTDFAKGISLLGGEGQQTLLAISHQRRTDRSLAASILLAATYFPHWSQPLLQRWASERAHDRGVVSRIAAYRAALMTMTPQANSPLGNARLNLTANFALYEAPLVRLSVAINAPITSLARRLCGLGHGQRVGNNRQASPQL